MKFPKHKREIDPKYVHWIHSYSCLICKKYPVQAHHSISKGAGGSDRSCVPLCQDHHTGLNGIHLLGIIHFETQFKITLEEEVIRLNQLYEQGETGPYFEYLAEGERNDT